MNTTVTSFSSEHSWLAPGSRRGSIESILSIQGKETDFVQDTSDTEALSNDDRDLEYEPVTEPDDDDEGPVDCESSGESDRDVIKTKVIEVEVGDDGDWVFADSEQSDSDDSDSEIDLFDYWRCVQCRAENNNPLYRYCQKCFQVRKNFFPPRPRPKQQRCKSKTDSSVPISVHNLTDSGIDSAFNSQELSHEIDKQINTNQSDNQSSIASVMATKVLGNNNLGECFVDTGLGPSTSSDASVNKTIIVKEETILNIRVDSILSDDNSKNKLEMDSKNSIKNKAYLKRRAESEDRNRKRLKIDYSESDTESSDNDRTRKSKSLDPVSPLLKTISDPSLTIDKVSIDNKDDNMCIVCVQEPKSGVFVHGRIAHICCCYKCAVKVWSKSKRCPVCNCRVSNVLKAIVM